MKGWRARLGFLVPPGNPTVEPEMMELAPPGVTLHFTRMSADGPAGTHSGQQERNLSQVASIPACVRLLAMVSPRVIVMAHTATSYTLGQAREAELVAQMEAAGGAHFITAFGSVLAAFAHLGVRRIAYATPYSAEMTSLGRQHLEDATSRLSVRATWLTSGTSTRRIASGPMQSPGRSIIPTPMRSSSERRRNADA